MRFGRKPTTTSALLSQSSDVTKSRCEFCTGKHYAHMCDSIGNLDWLARREKIKRMRLCFLCLGKHLAMDCWPKGHCYFCKGHHHAVLCPKKQITGRSRDHHDNTEVKEVVSKQSNVKPDIDSTHIGVAGVSYSKSDNQTTIMQVVKTVIGGVEVNVMFDSGSDRSFITSSCAQRLNLNVVGQETLNYCRFAEKTQVRDGKLRQIYEFAVDGQRLKLIGMDVICSSMYRSPVPKDVLEHFKCVSFNEDFRLGRSVKVDILIGLDHYWSLIKSDRKSSEGLVAQETAFGWMLSGGWSTKEHVRNVSCDEERKCLSLFCQSELSDKDVRRLWD